MRDILNNISLCAEGAKIDSISPIPLGLKDRDGVGPYSPDLLSAINLINTSA